MKRRANGKALTTARAELRELLGDLGRIRTRTRAIARNLRRAAKTAPVVTRGPGGEVYTLEHWLGKGIADWLDEDLGEVIRGFEQVSGRGTRREVLAYVARERAHEARMREKRP
jgi:hypothetical protein